MKLAREACGDISADLKKRVRKAQDEIARAGLEIAKELSSGSTTRDQMARMDYPFARRHGEPLLDPSIVNRQSGKFAESWQLTNENGSPGGPPPTIQNTDPIAAFLEQGTQKMFARPLAEAIAQKLDQQVNPILAKHTENQ